MKAFLWIHPQFYNNLEIPTTSALPLLPLCYRPNCSVANHKGSALPVSLLSYSFTFYPSLSHYISPSQVCSAIKAQHSWASLLSTLSSNLTHILLPLAWLCSTKKVQHCQRPYSPTSLLPLPPSHSCPLSSSPLTRLPQTFISYQSGLYLAVFMQFTVTLCPCW